MRLQLRWIDPNTQQVRSPTLETPIAFGSGFDAMPSAMKHQSVRRMVLAGEGVIPFHAILAVVKGNLAILDRQEGAGTRVNRTAQKVQIVKDGDRITIGPFEITVTVLSKAATHQPPASQSPVAPSADPFTDAPDPFAQPDRSPTLADSLPVSQPIDSGRSVGVGSSGGGSFGAAEGVMGLASGGSVGPASSTGNNAFGADGMCDRKVGFLFKRRCGRTTTQGCPDCKNGQIEPGRFSKGEAVPSRYQDDYAYYPNYGRYNRGYWGHDYYHNRHHYHYDPHSRHVDFNESDAASFEQEGDNDYEMDLDAS